MNHLQTFESYRDNRPTHYIVKEDNDYQYDEEGNIIMRWNKQEQCWDVLPQYEYDTIDYTKLDNYI